MNIVGGGGIGRVAFVALLLGASACGQQDDTFASSSGGHNEPADGITVLTMDDWTARAFAKRTLVEFGRSRSYESAPTNEMRLTTLDSSDTVTESAPFPTGLTEPAMAASEDRVFIIGRLCANVSTENIDSGGITCLDSEFAAATYDIDTSKWTLLAIPDGLLPQSDSVPKVDVAAFAGNTAVLTTYSSHGIDATAQRAIWNLHTGEVAVADAGWGALDEVGTCVLADGTRFDLVETNGLRRGASGEPNGDTRVLRTPPGSVKAEPSPVVEGVGPWALRCGGTDALIVEFEGETDSKIAGVKSLVDRVVPSLEGFELLPGSGLPVAVDSSLDRTKVVGPEGVSEFTGAIYGLAMSSGSDLLILDIYAGANEVLIRPDDVMGGDLSAASDLLPDPDAMVGTKKSLAEVRPSTTIALPEKKD